MLIYCHYDVQPADPLDEWIRPPFEPRHEDGRVYARGSGDDKGQLFMHLKAVEAWMRTTGSLPVNLRFFFEGDEEVGSEPIEQFIDEHPDLLAADVCVVSDGDTFDDDGTPAIGYGLRGIAYWEVRVQGPRHDVHSGQYGGGVDNPANVLVRILASLTDESGRFTVPGFYDRVRDLSSEERAAYAALPFDEAAWADETGIPAAMDGEQGHSLLERLSARPTFDINGISGGYTGAGAKTIIPAWATAKISTRLVPDQDYREVEQLVKRHIESLAPASVQVEVHVVHGGAPAITPLDHPGVAPASRALEAGFGTAPLFQRSGGSVPVVAALDAQLGLKTLMLGFANPTGNFHAPNEWISLRNIRDGMASLVHLWAELGSDAQGRSPRRQSGRRRLEQRLTAAPTARTVRCDIDFHRFSRPRDDALDARRPRRPVAAARRCVAFGGCRPRHAASVGGHREGAELPDPWRPSAFPAVEPRGHDQLATTASLRDGTTARLGAHDGRRASPAHATHRVRGSALAGTTHRGATGRVPPLGPADVPAGDRVRGRGEAGGTPDPPGRGGEDGRAVWGRGIARRTVAGRDRRGVPLLPVPGARRDHRDICGDVRPTRRTSPRRSTRPMRRSTRCWWRSSAPHRDRG